MDHSNAIKKLTEQLAELSAISAERAVGPTAIFAIKTTAPTPEERPSTLFPKIGKLSDFVDAYKYKIKTETENCHFDFSNTIVPLVGTVKLHGAHADIVIDQYDTVVLQSRNMVGLTAQKDVYDIAKSMFSLKPQARTLKKRFRDRFRKLNPGIPIDEEHPTIIAGEWIGPGVQKNVAISNLPRKVFVILSVSINNSWLPNGPYADICDETVGFYNISRGGFYKADLNLGAVEECHEVLMKHTLDVEKACPFGESFGISGIGEGIVWKAKHPLGNDAKYWFKTKGPLHAISTTDKLKKQPNGNQSEQSKANEFAKACVTEMRLQQGWDTMIEKGIPTNMKNMPEFFKWMWRDILDEEAKGMEALSVNKDLLKKKVVWMSKEWYLKKQRF
ncbi:hypothetical protein B0J14DRAFT_156589 [Halenospora varia]|nr:hypothetical protein B0J14DRAFT_156589 [Halenospora varia]